MLHNLKVSFHTLAPPPNNVNLFTKFYGLSNLFTDLAEGEDDVLVVLADVVHAGVVPRRDVGLRQVRAVRGVALVVALGKQSRYILTNFNFPGL